MNIGLTRPFPRGRKLIWAALALALVGSSKMLMSSLSTSLAFAGQDLHGMPLEFRETPGEMPLTELAGLDPAQRPRNPAIGRQRPSQPRPQTSSPPVPIQKPSPTSAGAPAVESPGKTDASPSSSVQKPPEQPTTSGGGVSFRLENADLLQFINLVASQLKINYIVDPAVRGTVTITTMGDLRREDLFPILQSVLEINGATAVQTQNFYRIIPVARAAKLPLQVYNDAKSETLPDDDRMMMEILPLRFVFASDMAKMLTPFLSDGGVVSVHEAGNVLILMDSSLNVKRLMEIIDQFDSSSFAEKRIKLIPVHNNVASGLVPELESIFTAYALSEKATPLRFVPIDRINSILVVTSDPSAFEELQKWVDKLDQPVPPSGIQTFIYRVQYSEANYLARLLTSIHGQGRGTTITASPVATEGRRPASGRDTRTGSGLGSGMTQEPRSSESDVESSQTVAGGVRITTDPVNNSLVLQCSAQQYAEIVKTLKDLDVIPREVMIQARVYEVTLTGDLSFGVDYYLQQRSAAVKKPLGSFTAQDGLQASMGILIGQTRELMMFLHATDNRTRVRVLSAPSVLAMDNSDAKIQVGSEIPILTSQAVEPVQSGGSSLFSNTIQNRDTGIILTVTPRITATGLVSLKIAQEISQAQPSAATAIQSPSFLKRLIQTQAVVGDNETIALGGLIQDSHTTTRNRIPLLGDIPYVGALFGSTSEQSSKTELIILLTPRIVKNIQEARDATRELRDSLTDLRQGFQKDKKLPFRSLDDAR
jgi:general secretion pathway protein D